MVLHFFGLYGPVHVHIFGAPCIEKTNTFNLSFILTYNLYSLNEIKAVRSPIFIFWQ